MSDDRQEAQQSGDDDESVEAFVEEVENDPSEEPPEHELKDIKGG